MNQNAVFGVEGPETTWNYLFFLELSQTVLTLSDYNCTYKVMTRVNTSQFKARLGQYLRAAREGQELVVMDRTTPVARLLPMSSTAQPPEPLVCSPKDPAAPAFGQLRIKSIRPRATNSSEVLRADRDRR